MNVIKRDGRREPMDLDKYHEMVGFFCEGLSGCSVSEIELAAAPQFVDGVKTSDIHKLTTKAIADLISLRKPNYQFAAARSLLTEIRKEVWGQYEPKPLIETINKNIKLGFYEDFHLYYTNDEIEHWASKIKYDRDLDFTYAGLSTAIDKFIVKSKTKSKLLETPQELNMLVAMAMFKEDPKRHSLILDYYNDLSTFKISLPSPIMSGLRTPSKGYASCCLIDTGDTTGSLTAANGAAVVMTAHKAGIGIHGGNIRGLGAGVRNGTVKHTGPVPILRWFEGAVKSFSQGSRGGSATSYHMFWNWDIEKILTLKSNKSTPENSVKKLDYGIGFNKLFFDRARNNETITLFSAEETRDLIDNLHTYSLWEETYLKYEQKRGIRKKKISARKLLKTFATERFETGRYYPLFLDNVNKGPIKASIRMSNLCAEILLEVEPLKDLYDEKGLIALCILSNVNAGKIKGLDELPRLANELVRSLDNIIDIQDYPLPAAENSTVNNRYLGIGISDWAHYLTKKKVKYDTEEALDYAEEFAEHLQFNLLTASMNLAKERGEAPNFRTKSKYADGWLPNDGKWKFISHEKWEQLRKDIVEFGLRHIVLSAIPPAGTSSDFSNSTSGIDMPRDLIITKKSKIGNFKQIVPNFAKGSQYYTLATELDNIKYLRMLARFQLYVDQAISTNVYWTENDFVMDSNGKPKFPMKLMVRSITEAHRMGLKTTYYSTFISILNELLETVEDEGCSGGGCAV